ncbi:hypothetical protein B566_EDAN009909 [Ephemera danica]|nr:hypothetical protein B566_EDAN009909 [Ephemera danica]
MMTAIYLAVAIGGSYMLSSALLFRYPTIIHKKKPICFRCRHISHRGGAGENYENTMVAFQRAVAIGTEMLELDCHLSKDGKAVVSHDHNLLRSCGLDVEIANINSSELPLLKPELSLDFDPGVIFKGSGLEEERTLALLDDVFRKFPTIPINIDIKVNNDMLIEEVARLIRLYQREAITVWGNYSDIVTTKCYKQNPDIPLLFSMRRVITLVLLLYSGLLPFFPIKETHLEIFLPSIYLRRKNSPSASYLPFQSMLVQSVEWLLMRKCLFKHLERRGIQTYLWVLNYEEEFAAAFELGATGVMTDYPSKLKKFLDNHPQYK